MSGGAHRPMISAVSVVVVDDSELLRLSVRLLIERDGRLAWLGEASDGDEAVDVVLALGPDAVLMDLSMPRCDGLDATAQLRRRGYRGRIVAFSGYGDEHMVREAHSAGTDTYVAKGSPPAELLDALIGEKP